MLVVTITALHKRFGYHPVLDGVSLQLNAGERVGVVGANGVGKSTLLKLIAGHLDADGGTVHLEPGLRLGYLPQHLIPDPTTAAQTIQQALDAAHETLHTLEGELRRLEHAMSQPQDADSMDALLTAYGEALDRFERGGGYSLDARTDAVLSGLGLAALPRERTLGTLSGGEGTRLGLALMLLRAPDLLLLDEPTNHLDFQAQAWLADYLAAYPGAALIVSHDRAFLNAAVSAVVEIDEHTRRAKRYVGNYDAYWAARQQALRRWRTDYAAQQDRVKALRHEIAVTARRNDNDRIGVRTGGDKFLRNFKRETHDHSVSRRVASAEEKLRRVEADPVPRPPDDLHFHGGLAGDAFRGRTPISAEGLCKRYGTRTVLDGIDLALEPRARVLLVGENGAGKSTLMRLLLGLESPDAGTLRRSPQAVVGYLPQDGDSLLDPAATLFEAYRAGIDQPDQVLKSLLLSVGLFRYDDLDKRVGALSRGQRRKLHLARLMASGANVLLLDEPSNDLSFDVVEGLEAALVDFPGPVIAATHDRHFMAHFGEEVWHLSGGRLHIHLDGPAGYFAGM